MKASDLLRKSFPHVIAVILFVFLSLAYVYPVLEGKRIFQSDIANHIGMSKEIVDYRTKTGQEALWTNSMFGGMPAYQISVLFKNNISGTLHKILTLGLPRPADMIFLYFIGFYILMILLGLNPWLAIGGAIAFAFSSYHFIIIEAGHNSKAVAIAYMAPVLGSIIYTLRGRYLAGGLLTAVFLGLEIYANHFQITYYLLLIVLIIGIAFLINAVLTRTLQQFLRALGVLVAAALVAVSLNFANLWTTWEYSKYTTRGGSELTQRPADIQTSGLDKDYATRWSYGIGETFSLMIPNVKGGATGQLALNKAALDKVTPQYREWVGNQNHYWGEQPFTSGPVYAGAIVIFLFMLGLLLLKGYMKWALLAATVLSILLSWGRNFMPFTDFFLEYIPGYNKFRAVSMTLVIAELCIPLLAFLSLKPIIDNPSAFKKRFKEFFIALGLTAGIALAFLIAPKLFFSFSSSQEIASLNEFKAGQPDIAGTADLLWKSLEDARVAIFTADALRSLIFILMAAALVIAFAFQKIKSGVFIIAITVLMIVDMWPVNRRYLNESNFVNRRQAETPFQPTQADLFILKDVDPHFRVLNLSTNTFNDAATSYFHKSIGGYHGAKLQRYQDLIDFHITKGNIKVLNMLNTKYIIQADENKKPVPQLNMEAMGNAWFVRSYDIVETVDDEINALNEIDLHNRAVIHRPFEKELEGKQLDYDSLATIQLTSYAPNRLTYLSNSQVQQLALFSEIFYDRGWKAFIDGKPWPHFRANYILRAMVVPEGKHDIEFRFEPASYFTGQKVSLVGSVIIILWFGWWLFSIIRLSCSRSSVEPSAK